MSARGTAQLLRALASSDYCWRSQAVYRSSPTIAAAEFLDPTGVALAQDRQHPQAS